MAMNYTPIPDEFLEEMGELSDAEYGRFIRWLQTYKVTGEMSKLCGNERFYCRRGKMQIDRYIAHYEERVETNRRNGSLGGKAKQSVPIASDCYQSVAMAPQTKTKTETKTETKTKISPNGEIPPKAPQGGRGADFDRFWAVYPKKVGKGAAKKAFEKVKVPVESLVSAIERQKCSEQWTKDNGQYIPNPSTWLNQERWEDELGGKPSATTGATGKLGDAEMEAIRRALEET